MSIVALFIQTALCLIIIAYYFKKKFTYWKYKNVYTEPPHIPFGNAYNLVRHKHSHGEEFQKLYNTFKDKKLQYGGYYAFTKPLFIPINLDLVKNIFVTHFEHFMDHIVHVNEEVEPLGVNLITQKGSKWKNLRAKLTPSFTSVKVKTMLPIVLNCSENLCKSFGKQMEETGAANAKDLVERYTTDVIGTSIFGIHCNSLQNPDEAFRLAGKKFFDVSTLRNSLVQLLSFLTPSILAFLRIPLIRQEVKDLFFKILRDNVEYRERHNIIRKDFLQSLIELKNKFSVTHEDGLNKIDTDERFTMDQLTAQCFLFLLAGFETTSSTITFILYELAINPVFQEKLRFEIKETVAMHQGKITYEALHQMTYMDQIVYETLRKYPVFPVLTRECTKSYQIPHSDVFLEKGTYVMIPVLGIHRDPDYYPNPVKFDPERFSKENSASRHSGAWIPFGIGPRSCIAERFGMLQVKVCLSALLIEYKFTLNNKTENPLTFDRCSTTILVPNGDVLLNIEKLN